MANLSSKQKKFIDEYLIDLNATEAAIRAGYSKKTARQTGYENLTKPYIKEIIEKAQQKVSEKSEMSLEEAIRELIEVIREPESQAIKLKALDMLFRHYGAYNDKLHVEGWEKKANERIFLIPEFREEDQN